MERQTSAWTDRWMDRAQFIGLIAISKKMNLKLKSADYLIHTFIKKLMEQLKKK